jgi:hypothetical protein
MNLELNIGYGNLRLLFILFSFLSVNHVQYVTVWSTKFHALCVIVTVHIPGTEIRHYYYIFTVKDCTFLAVYKR